MKRNNKIVPYSMCSWLLLMVFCMQFVVSFCAKNIWALFSSTSLNQYSYILLTQVFAIVVPCVLVCLFNGSGFGKTFGIKKLGFSKLSKCMALGFFLQPAAILLNIPLQRLVTTSGTSIAAPSDMNQVLYMLFFVCVLPAFCEEFLMRGMLLNSLKRKGYAYTIVVTTVLFVLLHNDVASVAGHAVLGAAAAFAVLNTNSVFAGIAVHMAFNFSGVLIDYITNRFYMQGGFVGSFDFFVALGVAGIVLSCIFLRGVYSKKMKKYASTDVLPNLCKAFLNIPVIVIVIIYIFCIVR